MRYIRACSTANWLILTHSLVVAAAAATISLSLGKSKETIHGKDALNKQFVQSKILTRHAALIMS